MGSAVPNVGDIPVRCHGHKHWLSYTVDERPCEYHVVVRYQDADGEYVGSVTVTVNPGGIRRVGGLTGEEATAKFQQLVGLYEAGKTAEEMVVAIEVNGFSGFFAEAWPAHRVCEGLE